MLQKNERNEFSMDGIPLKEIAAKFGTPCYVYSENQIKKNVAKLQTALSENFDKFRVQYAVKANSNPHILKILRDSGVGADCSSPMELRLAQNCDFPISRSTYTGNYESMDDLSRALKSGIPINLDDYHRLPDLLSMGMPELLSFRINPGIGRGGFEQIVTGGTDAKFGFPYEKTREAYKMAKEAGVKRFGIHMMTGSNILEAFYFAEITQKLFTIIEDSINDLGIELEFINIGGGLGVPYKSEEDPLNLNQALKMVSEVFKQFLPRLKIGQPELAMEPGRYLVADAGVLLSEVTHVKNSYRNYVGIDAGMSTLLRPAIYKAYHELYLDAKQENPNTSLDKFLICGQICENSDIHPVERSLSAPKAGDLAFITNAGAYGYTMSSNYNNRPRSCEVLISNGKSKLIRKRETEEDLLRNVPDFQWK